MVCSHRCSAEEGTSAPLLPKTAEEVWNEPQYPQILLLLHCGEHPDRLHHRLVWKQHRWQPQSVVRTARHIVGGELPSLQDIYTRQFIRKAWRIIKDSSHPSNSLRSLLPSGRRLRSIRFRTSQLRDSFFPQAIKLMNSKNEYTLQHTPTLQYAMHCTLTWTLTQFNWTTHTHCTNTTTYLLPLDIIQCTSMTWRIRPMYNLLLLFSHIIVCILVVGRYRR